MPLGIGGGADVGGGIGEGIGGAIGYATRPRSGKGYLEWALKLLQRIQEPEFDMTKLAAPDLQLLEQLAPELYNAQIEGRGPATIADSPDARRGQMESLSWLQDIGREGLPLLDRLQAQESQRALADQNQRSQHAVLENMRARGRLGGGTELAARIGQGQESADLAGRMGTDLAREGLNRRLQGMRDAGSLAGSIRGQDIGVQGHNADAINRFNEFMSNLRTNVAAANAGERQRVSTRNVEGQQRLSESNRMLKYGTDLENIERTNRLRELDYQNRLAKATGQAGILGDLASEQDLKQAQYIGAAKGLGGGVGGLLGAGVGGFV